MSAWRAIHTKPNCEPIADRMLDAIGIETFYPRRLVRLHRIGSAIVERPYFRGYLFADLEDCHLHDVMAARGVHTVVGTLPIPDPVILALKSRADENGIVAIPLEPGKSYTVFRPGALGQLVAKVERIDRRRRANVLIRLLGLEVKATVATMDLMAE